MTAELQTEPVSWFPGEDVISDHGLQSLSQGKGSFLEGQAETLMEVPVSGGPLCRVAVTYAP